MKKILIALVAFIATLNANATDVWTGSQAVTWENTINVSADKFADIKAGNKIVLDITVQAEDVVELKTNGQKLSGSRYQRLFSGNNNVEMFLTEVAVKQLKESGLEVCGSGFTVSKIWYGDGKDNVTANTIWTGYYWMDSWSTLEVWKEAFPEDLSNYSAIRFVSEAGRTDYVINVLATWEDKLADQSTMKMTNDYAELDFATLSSKQMEAFEKSDRVMIQCNKEGGSAFNFTSIELVPIETAIANVNMQSQNASADIYNIVGQKVSANQKGLVITNGKKYIKK